MVTQGRGPWPVARSSSAARHQGRVALSVVASPRTRVARVPQSRVRGTRSVRVGTRLTCHTRRHKDLGGPPSTPCLATDRASCLVLRVARETAPSLNDRLQLSLMVLPPLVAIRLHPPLAPPSARSDRTPHPLSPSPVRITLKGELHPPLTLLIKYSANAECDGPLSTPPRPASERRNGSCKRPLGDQCATMPTAVLML